ncbi:relaxase/mobilization nuclease domain-containing protein [Methyloceanibacter sp.]|uniref:relaxase/mobilization nuclease domain-containing protein n=1 Tax=Methyloceanibacter sp. TaxID=1965321 RepID=UPI003D6D8DDB
MDVVSYGRAVGRQFSASQRLYIARTVRRAPEVVVKVSGGGRSRAGVEAHLSYIGRGGELEIEMDDGRRVTGSSFQKSIVLDWDLDLEDHRRQDKHSIRRRPKPFKLVHNLIFSMPPGTSSDKLVKAVRGLAQNQFALKHRYAMALHTDEAHPHVHLVVKAMSEQGERLKIRKATLREWRYEFADHLREQGIAANATERAVRGQVRTKKLDAIYRSAERNESFYERKQIHELAAKTPSALARHRQGKAILEQTRSEVVAGWQAVAQRLREEGDHRLADDVRAFIDRMAPATTDQEQLVRKSAARAGWRKIEPMQRTR